MKKMIEIDGQELDLTKIPEREALQFILKEIVELNKTLNEILKGRPYANGKINKK